MPSDDSTVATQADFVPMAVGNTDRVRSVVSVSAHDGFSHQPRSGMQQGRLSVLAMEVATYAQIKKLHKRLGFRDNANTQAVRSNIAHLWFAAQ